MLEKSRRFEDLTLGKMRTAGLFSQDLSSVTPGSPERDKKHRTQCTKLAYKGHTGILKMLHILD